MSDSFDALLEMLPLGSSLQRADNPLRVVLDRTVGEWLDEFEQPFEQLFLTSATGGWLDAHGKDYGVPRKIDEDDDTYRQRIIYEKLDHLTPALLSDVYNVKLFTYRNDFDVKDNTLVSDNPHIVMNDSFLGLSDEDTIGILDKKFILDSVVTWINSDGEIEYILDTRGKNILSNYSKIYTSQDIHNLCGKNTSIQKVKLKLPSANNCTFLFMLCTSLESVNLILPNATICDGMFSMCRSLTSLDLVLPNANNCIGMLNGCRGLVTVDLDLPSATNCSQMLRMCNALKNVKLNLPQLSSYDYMFESTSNIETIDVNIPVNIVSGFKSYVTGLNLTNLTSFIINGEEQL